jgi:TRAP-type uncharacterized transport system substrate-binding protein
MEAERRRPRADQIRSILLLEMAAEMVTDRSWPATQARLMLRKQGSSFPWQYCLYASDAPSALQEVADGSVQLAMLNPAEPLAMAVRGTGPFKEPLPLSVITVLPSLDQFAFAVDERTGLESLADIPAKRYPLKISMREHLDHSDYLMTDQVFGALGFSLDDIVSWGGQIVRRKGLSWDHDAFARGEVDAYFEEAVKLWLPDALEDGMQVLPVDAGLLAEVEPIGIRGATLRQEEYPGLGKDVPTIDFSGWPIFTRSDAPDDLVRSFCAALEARKDRIPSEAGWFLPLDRMCKDGPDTPLTAPLHPAAEAFWRECGYLS